MSNLSEEKKLFVDQFLTAAHIARLATADREGHPHVVPVWYGWDGESVWISSYANTRKIGELEHNPYISISIDVADQNGETKAVILEGKAELIKEPRDLVEFQSTWIYKRYLGENGVLEKDPQRWIHDPLNLLVRLKPEKVMTWQF